MDARLEQLRAELTQGPSVTEELTKAKAEIQTAVQALLGPVQAELATNKELTHTTIRELKEKLAWLPLSLCQLEGMDPTEARLFTIEARLRSEENLRIRIQRDLKRLSEQISFGSTLPGVDTPELYRRTLSTQHHRRRHRSSADRPPEEVRKRVHDLTEEVLEVPEFSEEVVKYTREKCEWLESAVKPSKPPRTPRTPRLPIVIKRMS